MSILIVSHDWAIQNVVEQVGITCGYLATTAETLWEAKAKLSQLGYQQFALMVIDSGALGENAVDLQVEVHDLLQIWPDQYPGLPVVFLGTTLQKYAILAAQPALVPFILIPFSPHDLMQTLQPLLLPEDSYRGVPPSDAQHPVPGLEASRIHKPSQKVMPPYKP